MIAAKTTLRRGTNQRGRPAPAPATYNPGRRRSVRADDTSLPDRSGPCCCYRGRSCRRTPPAQDRKRRRAASPRLCAICACSHLPSRAPSGGPSPARETDGNTKCRSDAPQRRSRLQRQATYLDTCSRVLRNKRGVDRSQRLISSHNERRLASSTLIFHRASGPPAARISLSSSSQAHTKIALRLFFLVRRFKRRTSSGLPPFGRCSFVTTRFPGGCLPKHPANTIGWAAHAGEYAAMRGRGGGRSRPGLAFRSTLCGGGGALETPSAQRHARGAGSA